MGPLAPILRILSEDADSRVPGAWVKAVFVCPRASENGAQRDAKRWEKVTARTVMLTRAPAIKLVVDAGGRQRTETVGLEAWPARVEALLTEGTRNLHLQAADRDWHARLSKGGRWLVGRGRLSPVAGTAATATVPAHDRQPNHSLPAADPRVQALFVATGLFGLHGTLRGEQRDKYRQVQHFVELLRPLPVWQAARDGGHPLRIVDAGCGKAYLSLALYLFGQLRGVDIELHGVDRNGEVLQGVKAAAAELGYTGVAVHDEAIQEFAERSAAESVDLLVSLHACDTATDDAIVAGVALGAGAIVVAPCCQHELAGQLERNGPGRPGENGKHALLGPGLFRHRMADLLTDALRAAALEACGYHVDVLEFVSAEHTARNVMLRAWLRAPGPGRDVAAAKGRAAFEALAAEWAVQPSIARMLA